MVRLSKIVARLMLLPMSLLSWSGAQADLLLASPYDAALPAWSRVLEQHVDAEGRIDFAALAAAPEDLAIMVAAVGAVSPETHPDLFPSRAHVLAYHLNAYNALAMQGVLDRGIPAGFTSFLKRASFFLFRRVVIGGKKTNLYTYENAVIRPYGEARVHFALNCMVRDCPRLPQEAFVAETLEQQLEAAAMEFFRGDNHLRVDPAANRVEVSAILKFYTKDFVASGKGQDLHDYINRYAAVPVPADAKIRFIDYDWRINAQP